jgi:hypothetical protein
MVNGRYRSLLVFYSFLWVRKWFFGGLYVENQDLGIVRDDFGDFREYFSR